MKTGIQVFSVFLIAAAMLLTITACDFTGGLLFPSPVSTEQSIVVVTGDSNHRAVARYDLAGNSMGLLFSFLVETGTPRGVAIRDAFSVIVSLDTSDRLEEVFLNGSKENFYGSTDLDGDIYDVERGPDGRYYVIEGQQIEVFDSDGSRRLSRLIDQVTGACTMNSPRSLDFNSDGQLVVTNVSGTDDILVYDLNDGTATCASAVSFGGDPVGVLAHSNGSLYVTTQSDNQVWRADPDGSSATLIFATDTSIISQPAAIAEHPNGNILISSAALDSIEELDEDGNRVGTDPFIRDSLSVNVVDLEVVQGRE